MADVLDLILAAQRLLFDSWTDTGMPSRYSPSAEELEVTLTGSCLQYATLLQHRLTQLGVDGLTILWGRVHGMAHVLLHHAGTDLALDYMLRDPRTLTGRIDFLGIEPWSVVLARAESP